MNSEITKTITHRPAQDPANHITGAGVGWKLAISNTQSHRADMVCDNAKGYILFLIIPIFFVADISCRLNDVLEYISVVVTAFTFDNPHQSFKAHSCIHVLRRKFFKGTIRLAVEFHEY